MTNTPIPPTVKNTPNCHFIMMSTAIAKTSLTVIITTCGTIDVAASEMTPTSPVSLVTSSPVWYALSFG